MLRSLVARRERRSLEDASNRDEAPRLCSEDQIERRASISTVSSTASRQTYISLDSIPSRRSSVTTYTSESLCSPVSSSIPILNKTPWELNRYKKSSSVRRMRTAKLLPARIFKTLPREVYDCILEQIELIHLGGRRICPSCYLRDLHNLTLTSRMWDKAATIKLYRKVWLVTNEDHQKLPKVKVHGASRLKLLRRTLRERTPLARYIRELHMPDFQTLYHGATIEREDIINLVASLVMACPNLERLSGFHIPYTHKFDRLSHALSTRTNLKERLWFLSEEDYDDSEEDDCDQAGSYTAATEPTERFLELNSNHSKLTTLVLHQEQHRLSSPLTFRAIVGALMQFPTLRHLSISNLPATTFTNLALNALPPNLCSLRLENLRGVTEKGLLRFATSQLPMTLENLTLIHMDILDIRVLGEFLCPRLGSLARFTFCQNVTPTLPDGAPIPRFQSPILKYLHWEIQPKISSSIGVLPPSPSSPTIAIPSPLLFPQTEPITCLATTILSTSIRSSFFPSLRTVRTPHDPQGLLQSLCKPRASALLPSDMTLTSIPHPSAVVQPAERTPADIESPSSWFPLAPKQRSRAPSAQKHRPPPLSLNPSAVPCFAIQQMQTTTPSPSTPMSPVHCRLAAQSRIIDSRKHPYMVVRVTDPDGNVRVDQTLFGFLGTLGSPIEYEMKPDRHRRSASDSDRMNNKESEWIVNATDIVREQKEVCNTIRPNGCQHFGRMEREEVGLNEMF